MIEHPQHTPASRLPPGLRALSAGGALLAGMGVALSAYASHGIEGAGQRSLVIAAAMAFGHGVALVVLPRTRPGRLDGLALAGLALGSLLFCGGVVAGVFAGTGGGVAPFGGSLLILSWLLLAVASWRGR